MYDRILLPTDGNSRTHQVVEQARRVAELSGGTVHVVSVVPANAPDDSDATEAIESAAETLSASGRSVQTALLRGRPYEEILEYADEMDVDLIVMGTEGRSGLDRFMIGSVTERVLRTTDVPVLAVRLSADDDGTVTDVESAKAAARSALENQGHTLAAVPEEPYREANTWIVRAETEAGDLYNVHVEVATGETRLAEINT